MIIKEWWFKNYKSYGNVTQRIKLNDEGELILLVGANGNGKCVEKNTAIDIHIVDLVLTIELINYLETTDKGNKILQYIKETNNILYDRIYQFKKKELKV
jgi:hypothetical protein